MNFEEFVEYYESHNGRLPGESFNPRKNILNKKQLEYKYKQYQNKRIRDEDKFKNNIKKQYNKPMKIKIDEKWEDLKSQLDLSECTLMRFLKETKDYENLRLLKSNGSFLLKTIDPAHVFPRSGYPELKYDVENVIPLNRFSHSMMDQGRDPITGDRISKDITKLYWKALVGDETYSRLEEKINRRRNGKN